MDGGGDAPVGGLVDHREGGVAPGAHHQVWPELVQDGLGLLFGPAQIHQSAQIVDNLGGGKGAVEVGDGHCPDLIALLHAPVRPHKEDAAAGVLLLKDTGQGHRRVHMSRGAAAGKQYVHKNTSSILSGSRYLP